MILSMEKMKALFRVFMHYSNIFACPIITDSKIMMVIARFMQIAGGMQENENA